MKFSIFLRNWIKFWNFPCRKISKIVLMILLSWNRNFIFWEISWKWLKINNPEISLLLINLEIFWNKMGKKLFFWKKRLFGPKSSIMRLWFFWVKMWDKSKVSLPKIYSKNTKMRFLRWNWFFKDFLKNQNFKLIFCLLILLVVLINIVEIVSLMNMLVVGREGCFWCFWGQSDFIEIFRKFRFF